jgi:hypothetical protein
MRSLNIIVILLGGHILLSCNLKTETKVTDVKLVSVTQTDGVPEPPLPPPPISNFMTLQEWLFKMCDTETPDKSIIAYNFGLFETENGYTIYLIGSKEYDKDDQDWATNNDFEPSLKYYPLPTSQYKNLEWEKVLERIKYQLKDFTKTEKFKNSFFAKAKAITTGFDDGDLIKIK